MQPFVKWAGGKRQLLPTIKNKLPKEFNDYYEPFLGGGALLFELAPANAIVGDINTALINTYNYIKADPLNLMDLLDKYTEEHNSYSVQKDYYLDKRETFNNLIEKEIYDINSAALFMYLNKTCFNGLYRVNKKGLFNVPFNNANKINLYKKENITEISDYLKNVEINNLDFEETCKNAKQGDFVILDSPYAPITKATFTAYTKDKFNIDEQIRLAKVFKELSDKGVYCMLINHNTDLIRDLYKDYNIETVNVRRNINRVGNARTGEEVIITNYK